MENSRVQLRPGSLWIDGQPVIILASSLFYFRIAAEEWRGRMKLLVQAGYNAIDVYFPWNYHELEPGVWDFQGQRDVARFLTMAKEEGLWVIARPGPYICSEWDGGALPAYLSVEPDLRLRDADPRYLAAVGCWFGQILPLIAAQQIDRDGAVILVQIENELDFYDCQDRAGMMGALRDMALAAGIRAPLIACAGQGDIAGATGEVGGVVPVCNVYFDECDPLIEGRVRHYANLLKEKGYPPCIVETNRSHMDLRRMIVSGAKLVGPYLQAGGTDFGFSTGITNWGSPLAFMTSHYDFGGMISPGGALRAEGLEASLLAKLLKTLGPRVALAEAVTQLPVRVEGEVAASALRLDGGGWLVGLANPSEVAARVQLGAGAQLFPRKIDLVVEPKRCPLLLWQLPLADWGVPGEVLCVSTELLGKQLNAEQVELTFAVDGPFEIALRLAGAEPTQARGWQIEHEADVWQVWAEQDASETFAFDLPGKRKLVLHKVEREEAAGRGIAELTRARPNAVGAAPNWKLDLLDPCGAGWTAKGRACQDGKLHLEQNGIYRGYGFYHREQALQGAKGLLVQAAGDVLSTYMGSCWLGCLAPGGQDAFLALEPGEAGGPLSVRAEIWGHANFDDGRMPALCLKSLRGMGGMCAISDITNLTPNWFYQDGAAIPARTVIQDWPCLYFGGWSTTKDPAPGVYYREVSFAEGCDRRVLHFPELQLNLGIYIDGIWTGQVTPSNPWLDLSGHTRAGGTAWLAISVDRQLRRSTGQVLLYQGQALGGWQVAGWGEAEFARLADSPAASASAVSLPVKLGAGQMAWLRGQITQGQPGPVDLVITGREMKVSVWLGARLVGRLWLPAQERPRMAGGPDDRVYLPAAWIKEADGQLRLLLECTAGAGQGVLERAELAADL